MTTVYRVQDADGRGPFKPGFSGQWKTNPSPSASLPTGIEEFGLDFFLRLTPNAFYGTGVLTQAELARWFAPAEQRRLTFLGYRAIALSGVTVIRRSDNQVVFARPQPLRVGAIAVGWPNDDGRP